jgi:hypothetical protein
MKRLFMAYMMAWLCLSVSAQDAKDFNIQINTGGNTVTVTGYTGTVKDVVIPPRINGLPVTAIGNDAFNPWEGASEIDSVIIPSGVTTIGMDAFAFCAIKSLTIPDSVTVIEGYACYGCDNLTEVVLPAGLTAIKQYTFYECVNLAKIIIPAGVREIGYGAFYGCDSLSSTTVNEIRDKFGTLPFAVGR